MKPAGGEFVRTLAEVPLLLRVVNLEVEGRTLEDAALSTTSRGMTVEAVLDEVLDGSTVLLELVVRG